MIFPKCGTKCIGPLMFVFPSVYICLGASIMSTFFGDGPIKLAHCEKKGNIF